MPWVAKLGGGAGIVHCAERATEKIHHRFYRQTLKWSHAFSDYFQTPDTKGTNYLDLGAAYDVGGGWGVNGHVGRTSVHNFSEASYTDYKLGVTKDLSGWLLGASLVSTNAKHNCSSGDPYCLAKPNGGTYDAGKSTLVFSVGKTF